MAKNKFFEDLKQSLEEVIAFQEGKLKLNSKKIKIPNPPKIYTSREIKKIRQQKNYSQNLFAKVLNVSVKTIKAWELGIRTPSGSATRLLEIIDTGSLPKIHKQN